MVLVFVDPNLRSDHLHQSQRVAMEAALSDCAMLSHLNIGINKNAGPQMTCKNRVTFQYRSDNVGTDVEHRKVYFNCL